MKNLLSITISLLCAITFINAQSCLPNGITFSSQQQIDDFQSNYPGCTEIAGNVKIDEAIAGDITSLYGLENITSIGGYLRIYNNANLQYLGGLYNLESIGGYLKILANDNLTSLFSLYNLTTVGDELNISGNDLLEHLYGLDNITSIGGYLRIAYSDALTDIHGIEHIFNEGIESNNPDIDDLVIIYNPLLSDCLIENICILVNDGFTTTEIHDNAEGCNSQLQIENSCANTCLFSGITFTTQQQIDDFPTNYPSCHTIMGNVRIHESEDGNITNLQGLSQITLIKGAVRIYDNSALINLDGLENLTRVIEGDFIISTNATLSNLEALQSLTFIGGFLVIKENDNLVSLAGLENLQTVYHILEITSNNSLTNLNGLENLQTVQEIYIRYNNSLINLIGLENLQVMDRIEISENESLTNLNGLGNFENIFRFLCFNNNALAYCANEEICTLMESLAIDVHFAHNAPGCNSREEVAQACAPSCLDGGVTLSSQQEIDDFSIIYAFCTTVMGDLIIDESIIGDIIDLSGLAQLTTIDGALKIKGNFSLNNLTGLENIIELNGSLEIIGNAALVNISALQNIDPATIAASNSNEEDLEIYNNPQLDQCAIENICDALNTTDITTNIHDNATGCNTEEEVEVACLLNATVDLGGLATTITLYPNPVSDILTVELDNSIRSAAISMQIYSSIGVLIPFETERIDTHKFSVKLGASTPPGVYFIKMTDGQSQFISKFTFKA